jgi:D-alanyl-D-alanine carboxypeptidase (penicillin-binding protein 5/6)
MKRIVSFVLVMVLVAVLLPVGASAAGPEVAAKSAVLMDMTTGQVLYEHNAHEMLPPASVTKVMTLLLIMEAIDSGRIGWDDTVTASESAAAKGGSQVYLKVGETMTVTDMVKSIAVSSANDCACAMAEHISGSEGAFVEAMNEKAKALGMEHTHFLNCTGLDDDPQASNHLTCAMDIAIMSRALMMEHPDIRKFTTIWMDTIRNGSFGLSNTNKLVRFYPGATGLKTGFTQKAGYCLSATAQRDGMELVATVMGSESSRDRFNACKQLLDYGFANYALVTPQTEEGQVPVKLGTADTVKVMPKEKIQLLVDKAQRNQVNITTQLPDSIDAPVSKGQKIGTVTVRVGDQVVSEVPLLAQEAVPKLSWWQMFLRILRRICMAK